MRVYIERGVELADTGWCAAWTYDLDHWGVSGHRPTEEGAVARLLELTGAKDATIIEVIDGDEQAFDRDRRAPTAEERGRTLEILAACRRETIDLVSGATDAGLDRVATEPHLPAWVKWNSAREVAWHIADTESRYYLTQTGFAYCEPESDLLEELRASEERVRRVIINLPEEPTVNEAGGEVWTSVKLLRRLAWHEPLELRRLRRLITPA